MTVEQRTPSTVCYFGDCEAPPDHTPCCSSHSRDLCHAHYRRTHFVEVCGCDRYGCNDWRRR